MPIKVIPKGKLPKNQGGQVVEGHFHIFRTATGLHVGQVMHSYDGLETEPSTKFFTNPTLGIAMNQTISFGGSGKNATVVHAGVNSGSATNGTTDVTPQTNKLVDTDGLFNTFVGPGSLVHNTSVDEYALVTNVDSDTLLTLDSDIMDGTEETFVINDIWPGTSVQGLWNFADSGKFTITDGVQDDSATFTVNSAHVWNAVHFASFTGKIDLDSYDPSRNNMLLEFCLNGTLVGNSVDLNDFIDLGNFAEQNFVIPKASFGLSSQNFNSMKITILRSGGTRPDVKFDDFQWETEGNPLIFSLNVDAMDRFHIEELIFTYADALPGTLVNGTMPAISFDKILGLAALTNGFIITRKKDGETLFSATIKTLGEHRSAGAFADEPWSDGTNTFITLRAKFQRPLILSGEPGSSLTVQINDSMSDLLQFTASARGSLEKG